MQKDITKLAVVPMDGSKDAFKALAYIQTVYPADHKPNLEKARDMLIQAGISNDKIDIKVVDGGRRLAKILLDEAQKCKAGTIVLGRRGITDTKDYVTGSVTRKILNQAENLAVWVVS